MITEKMLRVQKQRNVRLLSFFCFIDRKMLRVQKPQIKNFGFLLLRNSDNSQKFVNFQELR